MVNKTAVLLHGLSKNKLCMQDLATHIGQAGFTVHNLEYPSTKHSLPKLATDFVLPQIHGAVNKEHELYFVTHSMGGIILRYLMQHHALGPIKRAVLLAPPNHGSEVADALKPFKWYYHWMGPAGQELGTDENSWPKKLAPLDTEFGIIAGNRNYNPISNWIINAPNDGRISIENTKLIGMKEFLIVPHHHSTLMMAPEVIEHTCQFLKYGTFELATEELAYEN